MESQSECRKCHNPIFWHKSRRTGKSYPTDSPTDRRAFHKCTGSEESPKPKGPAPITPSYFEPSIEERLTAVEQQVGDLVRAIRVVEARQPIDGQDVGF